MGIAYCDLKALRQERREETGGVRRWIKRRDRRKLYSLARQEIFPSAQVAFTIFGWNRKADTVRALKVYFPG